MLNYIHTDKKKLSKIFVTSVLQHWRDVTTIRKAFC